MAQRSAWTSELDSPKAPLHDAGLTGDLPWDHPALSNDSRWQLALRISSSASFSRSSLLSRFLLYVCEKSLTGKPEEITEHQIGVHVFGRRPGYNPGEDNIVRNYARQLRQRLDHYFSEEGKLEELRLDIPRGKYVPAFSPTIPDEPLVVAHGSPSAVSAPAETIEVHRESTLPINRRRAWLISFAGVFLIAAVVCIWFFLWRRASMEVDPSTPLWAQIFEKSRATYLVPADDGIVMFQNLTGHSVSLSEYISRDYLSVKNSHNIDAQNMRDLDAQRYTNVADLETVLKFSRLPQADPELFIVRYARELHMEDLKDTNAILLGSTFSNPWVELFQKNLNFVFTYKPVPNDSAIVNLKPQTGEQPVYANDAVGPSHRTYAVIALVPNLNSTGSVLLVEGLTMAGTQAAADILFNREAMRPFLEKARDTKGRIKPFEILIETQSFGSNAPQASIVASRIYDKLPPALGVSLF